MRVSIIPASLSAILVALAFSFTVIPATAQQTPSEQKCTNALNKNGSKVSKDMSKQAESCLKNFGKGKPLSPDVSVDTLEECVLDDPKDKIQKRKDRTESAFDQFCDPLPGFGATDPNTVNGAAMAKELNILRDIFGSDLDLVAIAESDPSFTDPGDARDASKCQRKVLKAVFKCQQAKMKEFLKCKKAGLKDLSIFDASGLEACYEGADPINISKKCTSPNGGIFKAVFKKCDKVDQRAFLSELFPGCVTDDSFGLAACLDRIVECRFCQYANAADGINRDCDLFDDRAANGSCPVTSLCGPCISNAECSEGTVCNAADICLPWCQCPPCDVCAGFCVPAPNCGETFPQCDGQCPSGTAPFCVQQSITGDCLCDGCVCQSSGLSCDTGCGDCICV